MAKAKKAYISNKDFLQEIKISKENGELTPKAIEMIIKIADKIVNTKFYYVIDDDKWTCMSQGIEDCLRYWQNFDADKYDNPFAYFTSIIWNGVQRQFNQLYKVPASKRISLNYKSKLYNI